MASNLTYFEKLKDPRWQKKRLEVFQRDNFTCLDCGSDKKTLTVHHCYYGKKEPWDVDLKFLMTVCNGCHDLRQDLEEDCKMALAIILARTTGTDYLREFVGEFVKHAANPGAEVSLCENSEVEYLSDIRWYHVACDIKPFREIYEKVIGRKQHWV